MNYIEYFKQEIMPVFGCTEPIVLVYAAAKAKEVLGTNPDRIIARLSDGMVKNINSIGVPGTDGRKGITISLVTGAFLGDAEKKLRVLENVDKNRLCKADALIEQEIVHTELVPGVSNLYIKAKEHSSGDYTKATLEDSHANITLIERNEEILYRQDRNISKENTISFSLEQIYDFARNTDYSEIRPILDMEIGYNIAIAEGDIHNNWGPDIGKLVLNKHLDDFVEKMVAYVSVGSDARMSGCEKPVVINSGSRNQGITVPVPIILYTREHHCGENRLYRALTFANLLGLYMRQGIGELLTYRGIVSTSSASVAGVVFLSRKGEKIIRELLTSSLAVNSGLICGGAKPSYAMKIVPSLRNAFLMHQQAKAGKGFRPGDEVVKGDFKETIHAVSVTARDDMKKTDKVILHEMVAETC